jgi:hypothetical protein
VIWGGKITAFVAGVVLAALVAGCGDSSGNAPDGGSSDATTQDASRDASMEIPIPDDAPVELYCELAPSFWCGWLDRCRQGCDAHFDGSGADADGWCTTLMDRVAEGAIAYDPRRASECLRFAQSELSAWCEEGEESRGALHDCIPFTGRKAPGESCSLPYLLESTCDAALGTCSAQPYVGRCPGMCIAYLDVGDACPVEPGRAERCGPALHCHDGVCAERAGDGAPCDTVPCGEGLRCVLAADELRCRPSRALGESCAGLDDCDDGLGCDVTGTCVDALSRGAPCRAADECEGSDFCGPDQQCTARVGSGGACVGGDCQPDHVCAFDADAMADTCQPRANAGDACDPGICAPGLWCEHASGGNRCAVVSEVGGSCAGPDSWALSSRCSSDAFCSDAGVCEAQRGADEPCVAGAEPPSQCRVDDGIACDPFTDTCLGPGAIEGARCIGYCAGALYCNVDICEPRVATGAACLAPDSCVAGADCVDLDGEDGEGPRCWARTRCDG